MSLEKPLNPSTNRGADSSLERRAEELDPTLVPRLREMAESHHHPDDRRRWKQAADTIEQQAQVIEQLLSENRQSRKSRTGDAKSHVELDLPGRLRDAVLAWLSSNEKAGPDVRWGAYPHGMVQRWIERAESAEARAWEIESGPAWKMAAKEQAALVAFLRQDLDRISAEREAYREAKKEAGRLLQRAERWDRDIRLTAAPHLPVYVLSGGLRDDLARILAENDR